MEEATMLYRAPGPEKIHGHDVEYTVVDAHEVDEYLSAGWHRSAVEAGEAHQKALAEAAANETDEVESKSAATRDEAIEKLEQLGVPFDRRWGVTRLTKLVEDTLAGKSTAENGNGTGSAPQG